MYARLASQEQYCVGVCDLLWFWFELFLVNEVLPLVAVIIVLLLPATMNGVRL